MGKWQGWGVLLGTDLMVSEKEKHRTVVLREQDRLGSKWRGKLQAELLRREENCWKLPSSYDDLSKRAENCLMPTDGEQGGVSSLPGLKAWQKGTLVLEYISLNTFHKHFSSIYYQVREHIFMPRKLPLFLLKCEFHVILYLEYGK